MSIPAFKDNFALPGENKVCRVGIKLKFIFSFFFFVGLSFYLYAGQEIEQRFEKERVINYNVTFNRIPSGRIKWEYLGKDTLKGEEVIALAIESNTDILNLLNLVSSEKIYLNASTNLPVKVERDVSLFGKDELIEENYDQEEGKVTIVRKDSKKKIKEEVYKQDTPIHNILELLYFFPSDIDLEEAKGRWLSFNLPNQQVEIRFSSKRQVKVDGQAREAYFLEGKGARRFNLWLCQEKRLPLRLDFLFWVGRIRIRKEAN